MTKKISLIFLCALIISLANTERYFGPFINRFFPCVQNPNSSFPCFGWVDFGIIIAALLVAAYTTGRLVVLLFKSQADS